MKRLILMFLICSTYGCASIKYPSAPPQVSYLLNLQKAFPEITPKGSSRFENTQLIFVHADQVSEFAVGLLVPVPFVSDAVIDAHKKDVATTLEQKYHDISVFEITKSEITNNFKLKIGEGGFDLFPLLFIEECIDDVYRLSLAYQLERGVWINRYFYHLSTKIPLSDIGNPSAIVLQKLAEEIRQGAIQLLAIIEKDIDQKYQQALYKAKIGSLYIVGSKISGITSPNIISYRHSEVLEEVDDTVVVRVSGDPKGKAKAGGMAFGVHYFKLAQMHTFEREE